MKFRLNLLTLSLLRGEVTIDFSEVSYFWGQMGSGKTSIARLVDYCLGGDIQLSPALQGEFVSATLSLSLDQGDLSIERPRDSDRVIASWGQGDDAYHLNLPSRRPEGEVMPGTGVEVLSDLLFRLSGLMPPRVRKSKTKDDSDLARLSMRDLLWYCYLDQDEIDSSFFHLEENAPFYLRAKSKDVLRYIIGFHSEKVAELEAELDVLRGERHAITTTIEALSRALKEVGAESEDHLQARITSLKAQADQLSVAIDEARKATRDEYGTTHAADDLRLTARSLGEEISRIDEAIKDILQIQARDSRHLHEIETLALKFRRANSAKAILAGVAFESCPRCVQPLPESGEGRCPVCGQADHIQTIDPTEAAIVERDAKARIAELSDILAKHGARLDLLRHQREEQQATKGRIERERNEALARYDTAYLSKMLATERERASLIQEAENLLGMLRLPKMVEAERARLVDLAGRDQALRLELKAARAAVESDDSSLNRLKALFLDCLVRAGIPGITSDDRVEIPRPSFYPEVFGPNPDDRAVTTFATISSGGKKTLFKCCFAIAVHRLAAELGAPLPAVLIIDSPMKNISERENRDQFEGFYRMLYELESSSLRATQLILIDKEFSPPESEVPFTLLQRHMRPGDAENPPLIPYYEGK